MCSNKGWIKHTWLKPWAKQQRHFQIQSLCCNSDHMPIAKGEEQQRDTRVCLSCTCPTFPVSLSKSTYSLAGTCLWSPSRLAAKNCRERFVPVATKAWRGRERKWRENNISKKDSKEQFPEKLHEWYMTVLVQNDSNINSQPWYTICFLRYFGWCLKSHFHYTIILVLFWCFRLSSSHALTTATPSWLVYLQMPPDLYTSTLLPSLAASRHCYWPTELWRDQPLPTSRPWLNHTFQHVHFTLLQTICLLLHHC